MAAYRFLLSVLVSISAAFTSNALAQDLNAPLVLVAQRKMEGEFFGSTVLITKPMGNGRHVGFIVNRPTQFTLGNLFPAHPASQKVPDPVFLGGPLNTQFVFALVNRPENPGGRSMQLAPELYVVMDSATVDHIIETDTSHARFVAGLVAWDAGELEDELKRGLWHVHDADAKVLMEERVEGMWEKMVLSSERRKNGI